jgi:FixJ family two-component response regulator
LIGADDPTLDAGMIAIIDDDIAVRWATNCLLRSLGYSTEMFSSADDFLRSGRIEEATCIITDVQMPGTTGVELQKRLNADGYRVPLIFVTGFPTKRTLDRVMAAGAFGFLTKPLRQECLIECLESALTHNAIKARRA